MSSKRIVKMKKISLYQNDLAPLLKLAIPLALTGIVQSATYFFETLFLAHLGKEVLAAGALVGWLFATIAVVLFGTLSSINIVVAHKFGEQDHSGICLIVRDGVWLSLFFSVAIFALCWNMAPVFLFFGQTETVVALAKSYLHALAWGIPPSFLMLAIYEWMVGLGRARTIMFFSTFTVSITIFFSYAFIFGELGLPKLGIAGAGWGITFGNVISVIVLLGYVILHKNLRAYFNKLFCFQSPSHLKELVQLGAPIGIMYSVEVGFFFVLSLIMGALGTTELAANQVGLQYLGFLMSIIFSIAQAITVRMGHLLGAKEYQRVEMAAYLGIALSVALMILVAIVFWISPETLIALDFNIHDPNNVTLLMLTKQILFISAIFQILESARIALFGALRACKDTHFTLMISILSIWCISLPLGLGFVKVFAWGGAGLWWGMVVGVAISIVLLFKRFQLKLHHYRLSNTKIA